MRETGERHDYSFMVTTLWNDVYSPEGIQRTLIQLVTRLDEREQAAKKRRYWYTFLISVAMLFMTAATFYAAYMTHETARHTGAIVYDSRGQAASKAGELSTIPSVTGTYVK